MWKSRALIIIYLALIPLALVGQGKYHLPPLNEYKEATIGLLNQERHKVHTLTLTPDSLSYVLHEKKVTCHLNEVEYIQVHEASTYAKRGALIGAGAGLMASVFSTFSDKSDPSVSISSNSVGTILLSTAGGAVMGAIIGSAFLVKSTYYIHDSEHEQK